MFKSSLTTPHTKIVHRVIPGRPLRLSIFGATCSSSNSNSLARSASSIYRCCNPLKIFGMSSRDLRSNFIFEMSTSPICICTFCTTRIVFFLRQNITLSNTLTYSMNVPHHTVNGEQNCEPDEEYFITSNRQDLGAKIPGKIPSLPHTSAKNCHSSYTSRQSSCRQNSTKLAPLRGNRGSRLGSRPNTIYAPSLSGRSGCLVTVPVRRRFPPSEETKPRRSGNEKCRRLRPCAGRSR